MQQNGVLAGERLVFMYGTLKAGQPNHHYIRDAANGRAEFICSARSVQCFPLVVATIHRLPFLLWLPGEGRRIDGEIYRVDDRMTDWLDEFEGHPDYYERDRLRVVPHGRRRGAPPPVVAVRSLTQKLCGLRPSATTSLDSDDGYGPPDDGHGPTDDGHGPTDDAHGPTDGGHGPPGDTELECWCYFLKRFPTQIRTLTPLSCYSAHAGFRSEVHSRPHSHDVVNVNDLISADLVPTIKAATSDEELFESDNLYKALLTERRDT